MLSTLARFGNRYSWINLQGNDNNNGITRIHILQCQTNYNFDWAHIGHILLISFFFYLLSCSLALSRLRLPIQQGWFLMADGPSSYLQSFDGWWKWIQIDRIQTLALWLQGQHANLITIIVPSEFWWLMEMDSKRQDSNSGPSTTRPAG